MTRQVNIEIRAALGQAFRNALSTTENRLSSLKQTIGTLSSQAGSVQTLRVLRERVSDLTRDTGRYDAEIVKLKSDLKATETAQAGLKKIVSDSKKELAQANREVQKGSDSHMTAKARLSMLTAEFGRNRTKTDEQKKALREAGAEVDKARQKLDLARESQQKASAVYADHKTQLGATTAAVTSNQRAIDKATKSLDISSSALSKAKDRVDQYEKELTDAGYDVNQLTNAEKRLGVQLAKNQHAYADVSRSRMLAQRARELQSSAISDFYTLAASTAALAVPIKTAGDFEQAIAKVGATTQATSEEVAELARLARDLGKDTVYSATDAANAQSYLG